MAETNIELARRGFEAALRGDLDVIAGLLDGEVKWHGGDPAAPRACHNAEQALAFMRGAFGRGGVGELVEVLGCADKVVVIIRRSSADGEPAALSANLSTFRDGKVVEMVHYPSPADARAAAGV